MAKSKFVGEPAEMKIPQCFGCRRYLGNGRCAAFEVIPEVILNNFHDHRKPFPGDRGIQFEPIEEPANAR